MSEHITPTVEEVVYVDTDKVACDGPHHGRHPRVYLKMTDEDFVVCPYCSRTFVRRGEQAA